MEQVFYALAPAAWLAMLAAAVVILAQLVRIAEALEAIACGRPSGRRRLRRVLQAAMRPMVPGPRTSGFEINDEND